MRVIIVFVVGLFSVAVFTDPARPIRPRALLLVGICCVVAGALLMRRFV